MRSRIQWSNYLGPFGRNLLFELDYSPDQIGYDGTNPITEALREDPDKFWAMAHKIQGCNLINICRTAVLVQMAVFDRQNGPEQDGEPKAIRRHWYAYFKVELAQPLARARYNALGVGMDFNKEGVLSMNNDDWSDRLSQIYKELVDSGELTYDDLWVSDASRMMEMIEYVLFRNCHIMLAVEKDSLFRDFRVAAEAIGARCIFSGKGVSSAAAIELAMRTYYNWKSPDDVRQLNYWERESYKPPFSREHPLVIIHISDYDPPGEAVIGPTFGEQAKRYAGSYIREARVGIQPHQVEDKGGYELAEAKRYEIKVSNGGHIRWAEEKGLFFFEDEREFFLGSGPHNGSGWLSPKEHTVYGFEVEALYTRDYSGLIVDTLLRVLDFDYIVERLDAECQVSEYWASDDLFEQTHQDDVYGKYSSAVRALEAFRSHEKYQRIRRVEQHLLHLIEQYKSRVVNQLGSVIRTAASEIDWSDYETRPEPDDFRNHVINARRGSGPWRPFRESERRQNLVEYIIDNESHLNLEDITPADVVGHTARQRADFWERAREREHQS